MEGLSLLLKKSQEEGKLSRIKVSKIVNILHLLFFDDVLIMTNENLHEWREIKEILKIFCCSTRLQINWSKSMFHYANLQDQTLVQLKGIFPYNFIHLLQGFKYLGDYIKAEYYKTTDWD
jgi:hypothetical protein